MDGAEFKGAQNPVPPDVWTVFDSSSASVPSDKSRLCHAHFGCRCDDDGGGGGGYYQSKRLEINPLWCEFAQCSIRGTVSSNPPSLTMSHRKKEGAEVKVWLHNLTNFPDVYQIILLICCVLLNKLSQKNNDFKDGSPTAPRPH